MTWSNSVKAKLLLAILIFFCVSAVAQVGWPVSHAYAVNKTLLGDDDKYAMTLDIAGNYKFWDLDAAKLHFKTTNKEIADQKITELKVSSNPSYRFDWEKEKKRGEKGIKLKLNEGNTTTDWWVPFDAIDDAFINDKFYFSRGWIPSSQKGFVEVFDLGARGTSKRTYRYYLLEKGKSPELILKDKFNYFEQNKLVNPVMSPDGKLLVGLTFGGVYDIEQKKMLFVSTAIEKMALNFGGAGTFFDTENNILLVGSKWNYSAFFEFSLTKDEELAGFDPSKGVSDNTWQHNTYLAKNGRNHFYSYTDKSFSLNRNAHPNDNDEILSHDYRLHLWRIRFGEKPVLLVDPDDQAVFEKLSLERRAYNTYSTIKDYCDKFMDVYSRGKTIQYRTYGVKSNLKAEGEYVEVKFPSEGEYEVCFIGRDIQSAKIYDAEDKKWIPADFTLVADKEGAFKNKVLGNIKVGQKSELRYYLIGKTPQFATMYLLKEK